MNIKQSLSRLALVAMSCAMISCSAEQSGSHVAIVTPVDGAIVGTTFDVEMAVEGMTVHKAGDVIPDTGHHHLIIDGTYIPMGETIVSDRMHLHYGKGQTKATLHLLPGDHTLTLQFANGHHKSYGAALSQSIHVHVK
ncbi:MAG: DUF4399 domain-containing protein [Mariprofundus sp.]|nr:DUF4399 domain-containing protein [Mariprofundus sp.]